MSPHDPDSDNVIDPSPALREMVRDLARVHAAWQKLIRRQKELAALEIYEAIPDLDPKFVVTLMHCVPEGQDARGREELAHALRPWLAWIHDPQVREAAVAPVQNELARQRRGREALYGRRRKLTEQRHRAIAEAIRAGLDEDESIIQHLTEFHTDLFTHRGELMDLRLYLERYRRSQQT
jgi:hypothetical protein